MSKKSILFVGKKDLNLFQKINQEFHVSWIYIDANDLETYNFTNKEVVIINGESFYGKTFDSANIFKQINDQSPVLFLLTSPIDINFFTGKLIFPVEHENYALIIDILKLYLEKNYHF